MPGVVGVDIGAAVCRLAQVTPGRKMPIILRNTLSNESTPCIVSYPDEGQRLYGEAALGKELSRPQQTVTVLKQALRADLAAVPSMKLTGTPVAVDGSDVVFTLGDQRLLPCQVAGFFLHHVLSFAAEAPSSVALVAPVGASAAYRSGLKNAAVIAGVPRDEVLVVDEADALALYMHHLQYADLPASFDDAARVLIINAGEQATSVVAVAVSQPAVEVLAAAGCTTGVSVIDEVLARSVFTAIQKKHGEDMTTHAKSYNKIIRECKKAKVMLSTTDRVSVAFESLKNDIDYTVAFTTAELEAATSEFAAALSHMISSVLTAAGLAAGEGLRVEVVGNGWRSPVIAKAIKQAVGTQKLGLSLDSNMCAAEGAAIYGTVVACAKADGDAANAYDAVHRVAYSRGPACPAVEAAEVASEELHAAWAAAEAASFAIDETHRLRLKALNDFEAAVFRTKEAIAAAFESHDAASKAKADEYVGQQEQWLYNAQDGIVEGFTAETVDARHAAFAAHLAANFPQIEAHWEKAREKDRQRDEMLAKLSLEQDADKELKSDPQRLRGAQERREQGVSLFKQEHYEEAQTRFVQALTILGNLYDVTGQNKIQRDEIALSCHLNIASCSVKLGLWKIAVNNCTKALDIKPDHPKALYRRGQANAQLNELEAAKADLERALSVSGGDVAVSAELEAVLARISAAKSKEKKMFAKMFA